MRCAVFTDWVASGRLKALREGDPTLTADTGRWVRWGLFSHPWICARCRAFQHNDAVLEAILQAQQQRWRDWEQADADDGAGGPSAEPASGPGERPPRQ